MKKLLLLFVLTLVFQLNANAFVYLDETYTGNAAYHAADFLPEADPRDTTFLGGSVANGHIDWIARQFTVDNYSIANYVSVYGTLKPNLFKYDDYRDQYIEDLRNKGLTTDEITLELTDFVGPPQSMDVEFTIIKGSKIKEFYSNPFPGSEVIATGKYTFFTDNSLKDKTISNILIPFSPFENYLDPNQDYWIKASDPKFKGMNFSYSTKLAGQVTTPEPATMLLMGGGLAGMYWRRRKMTRKS